MARTPARTTQNVADIITVTGPNACIKLVDDSGNFGIVKVGNSQLTIAADPDNAVSSTDLVFDMDGSEVARFLQGGNFGIGTTTPTSKLHVVSLPTYANNAAAITGGLTAGAFYQDGGNPSLVCVVT